MAGQRSSKKNRRSQIANARCRRSVVGVGTSAGAFLAFGLGPLAAAPSVNADPLTDLIDVLVEPAIAASSGIGPAEFLDPAVLDAALTELAIPAGWDNAIADLGSLGAIGTADVGSAASSANPFDSWLLGVEQSWINSPLGQQVDSALNAWFYQVDPAADPTGGACGLICNGADGTGGGTLAQATGQGAGLFLGNGGDGATDAAGQGGNGGDAGWWGDGGDGGAGANGAAGGDGGAGGLFDGNGGDGGNGTVANPAGGAGGAGGDVGALSFFSTPGSLGSPGVPLLGHGTVGSNG